MKSCANRKQTEEGFYCAAADYKTCGGGSCAFYITGEAAKASREKADKRLRTLTELEQRCISEKYYQGKMPWKNNSKNI